MQALLLPGAEFIIASESGLVWVVPEEDPAVGCLAFLSCLAPSIRQEGSFLVA